MVARVGAREIRASDLQREAERRQNLHRAVPGREALLQEMIQQEALLQRARQAGLDQDPQLAHEIENLLIGRLMERELTRQIETVKVTPAEIQAEYEASLARFTKPAKARLAILFLEAGAKSSPASRTQTRERLAEARRKFQDNPEAVRRTALNPGFGTLAPEYSDDQASRYRGGDIGWIDVGNFSGRWPKSVLETACSLEVNRISEILETDAGYYLVMKTDARPGSVTPLAQLEPELRQSLLLKKRRELDETYRKETMRQAGVTIITNALQLVQLPAAAPAVARQGDSGPPGFPGSKDSTRSN